MATPAWCETLFGPPQYVVGDIGWAGIEERTGLRFPDDYRAFAEAYPELKIDDYLYIHHPTSLTGINLVEAAPTMIERIKSWDEPQENVVYDPVKDYSTIRRAPYPFHPAANGLYPWGQTENHALCWLTAPDSEQWTIVVADDWSLWHYLGSFSNFLTQFLTRAIEIPSFEPTPPDAAFGINVRQRFP